ncbi:MAG: hypothetical protein ACI9N1_001695 [Flavobacteriales bacterium]|jgi:hypothetical protein
MTHNGHQNFTNFCFINFLNPSLSYLQRNTDDCFKSMMSHSNGKTLGNTRIHCKLYRREKEFYNLLDADSTFSPTKDGLDCLMTMKQEESLYRNIYDIRNREIVNFLNNKSPKRLIKIDLNDPQKWIKLGGFFEMKIKKNYEVHSNKS